MHLHVGFHVFGWVAGAILGVALMLVVARQAHGGPLDPPAPPTSTMSSLDDALPVWSQSLPFDDGADR